MNLAFVLTIIGAAIALIFQRKIDKWIVRYALMGTILGIIISASATKITEQKIVSIVMLEENQIIYFPNGASLIKETAIYHFTGSSLATKTNGKIKYSFLSFNEKNQLESREISQETIRAIIEVKDQKGIIRKYIERTTYEYPGLTPLLEFTPIKKTRPEDSNPQYEFIVPAGTIKEI